MGNWYGMTLEQAKAHEAKQPKKAEPSPPKTIDECLERLVVLGKWGDIDEIETERCRRFIREYHDQTA